ncbi:hypothetical protein [Magnetospira thiophila]
MARTVLQRLLDEITDETGGPALARWTDDAAIDRQITAFREILDGLPLSFERLQAMAREERDFGALLAETRLRALIEHCRIVLGVLNKQQ